jgi:hypothetical protein
MRDFSAAFVTLLQIHTLALRGFSEMFDTHTIKRCVALQERSGCENLQDYWIFDGHFCADE